jgi:hypothetical protein
MLIGSAGVRWTLSTIGERRLHGGDPGFTAASASAPTAVLTETATVHLYQDVARSRAFGRRRKEVAASTQATK